MNGILDGHRADPHLPWILALVLALAACIPPSALAADGEALYSERLCVTCHGAKGNAPIGPGYPKLAGQNKQYLITQMKDIRSGARDNGLTAAMKPMVAPVTDAEFEAIAEYLSGL